MWHQKHNHRWKAVTSNRHYKSLVRDVYPFIRDFTAEYGVDQLQTIEWFQENLNNIDVDCIQKLYNH